MKKYYNLMGVLVVFLLIFGGCGTNTNTDPDTDTNTNTNKTLNGSEDTNTNAGKNEDMMPPAPDSESKIELVYTEERIIQPKIAEEVIKDSATKVMAALKSKDFATLAKFAHPDKGVRFTPYTYVSLDTDLVFTKEELKDFLSLTKEYTWGTYDGSGEEMKLTPEKYYEKFIYSADFLHAEQVGYNEVLSLGNMLENQFEVYSEAIIVEYYFSGFNPDYEGIDWQSLRLVFQQNEEAWCLVGIIHNQWTI